VLEDQVQIEKELDSEKKNKVHKSQHLSIKNGSEEWELGVSSHKVTQKESLLTKIFLKQGHSKEVFIN